MSSDDIINVIKDRSNVALWVYNVTLKNGALSLSPWRCTNSLKCTKCIAIGTWETGDLQGLVGGSVWKPNANCNNFRLTLSFVCENRETETWWHALRRPSSYIIGYPNRGSRSWLVDIKLVLQIRRKQPRLSEKARGLRLDLYIVKSSIFPRMGSTYALLHLLVCLK